MSWLSALYAGSNPTLATLRACKQKTTRGAHSTAPVRDRRETRATKLSSLDSHISRYVVCSYPGFSMPRLRIDMPMHHLAHRRLPRWRWPRPNRILPGCACTWCIPGSALRYQESRHATANALKRHGSFSCNLLECPAHRHHVVAIASSHEDILAMRQQSSAQRQVCWGQPGHASCPLGHCWPIRRVIRTWSVRKLFCGPIPRSAGTRYAREHNHTEHMDCLHHVSRGRPHWLPRVARNPRRADKFSEHLRMAAVDLYIGANVPARLCVKLPQV